MNSKQLIKQTGLVFALMVVALSVASLLPVASAALITGEDVPTDVAAATGGTGDLRELVLRIVNYFLGFLGVAAVIMVIYGGVLYVTAAGNDDATGKAKKVIMYALVGIIIILLSFALVNTILGAGVSGGQ